MDGSGPHVGVVPRVFQVSSGGQLLEVATLPITEPSTFGMFNPIIPAPDGAGQGKVIVTVGGDGVLYAATWNAVYKQGQNGVFSLICNYPYQEILSGPWPDSSNGYGKIASLAVDDQGRVYIGNESFSMDGSGPHVGVVPRVFQVSSGGQLLEVATLPITEPSTFGMFNPIIPAPDGAGQGKVIVTVGGDGVLYAATWNAVYKQGQYGDFSLICNYPYQEILSGPWPASSNGYGKIASLSVAARRPLVFIPGIAGSELRGGAGGAKYWPTVHSADIDHLNLNTGLPGLIATDIVRRGIVYTYLGYNYDSGNVYDNFIQDLTARQYTEYSLNGSRDAMTSEFSSRTQNLIPRPSLFCFPYDWRKSNTDHVDTLHDYINNISDLYGGAKVNVATHSMGGLLFRAYLLKYKNENKINKVVTVNLPFWGAPVAFYRMLAGEFFEAVTGGPVLDYYTDAAQTRALPTFPAFHQLLPSEFYLNAVGGIMSEEGWDFDGNQIDHEVYDSVKLKAQIDAKSGQYKPPYTNNMEFHTLGQDDWSGDDTSINMLHLITRRSAMDTAVGLKFITHTEVAYDRGGLPYTRSSGPIYKKVLGYGDGVVPYLSASRNGGYNGPSASYYVVPTTDDSKAEHTGALDNMDVWNTIDDFLSNGRINSPTPSMAQPQTASPLPATGRKSIEIYGINYVHITDNAGNQNTKVGDIAALKVPDVAIDYGGTSPWVRLDFTADKNLTITSDPGNAGVEIVSSERDSSDTVIAVTRYRLATGNYAWNLVLASGQPPVVKLDVDNSGTFGADETVAPTKTLSGINIDTTPPTISLSIASAAGEGVTMSITGADNSGTQPTLRYSVNDGALQDYTAALSFSAGQITGLKFFAEDDAGNTSGLIQTTVHPTIQSTADNSGNFQLEWPISDGYVLEVSDDLVTWTTSIDPVTRNPESQSVSMSITGIERKFYRLRSQQVEK